jgi:cell division protein FtsZ
VIASLASELGALTIAVVTKPFKFEGKKRQIQAERGLEELRESVDTVITIPNERLLATIARSTSLTDAFASADDVLRQAIQGISDLILVPGLINLDFADVKTVMAGMGLAIMGTGLSEGDGRAMTAANAAISSPLLEDASVKGARGVIINVTGGPDLSLIEVSEASAIIQEAAHEEANIIFGAVVDPKMEGKVKITVIATGFDRQSAKPAASSAAITPVDLHSYTAWKQETGERVAASGGSRMSFSRRAVLDLPITAPRNERELLEPAAPGAEFEPVSPLDVPAFLRRQAD